jgi:hypothetical protein
MKDIHQEINAKYPNATINNARSIVRSRINKAIDMPSESKMQGVENDFGFPSDFSEKDYGEEPVELEE